MADSTISGLTAALSVNSTDVTVIDQAGVTKKATIAQIAAGIATTINPSVGNLTTTGVLAAGVFSDPYTDGIVVDYSSPNGRVSVGASDNILFYTGGIANTLMGGFYNSANAGSTGLFNVGGALYADTGILAGLTGSSNSYQQLLVQNKSNGAVASTDVVVSNNSGTATTFYGNFGINSSAFSGSGSFNAPNATYLTATSGDLAIGTTTANGIHFVVNNGATDVMAISSAGVISGASITALFASPPPIGTTTPSAGKFTTGTFTTSGAAGTGTVIINDTGAGGANLLFQGDGATTPSKYIRVSAGAMQWLSDGYAAVIAQLTDAGVFSTLVGYLANGVAVPTVSSTSTLTNKTLLANGPNTVEATSGPGTTALSSRNRLDNGAFIISQRFGLTSQTLVQSVVTAASDRWLVSVNAVNGTFGTVNLNGPNNDPAENLLQIVGGVGTTNPTWYQRMEAMRTRDLANRQVTLSFWVNQASGSTLPIGASLQRPNSGTDNWATGGTTDVTLTCSPATIPTGVWTKVTATGSLTNAATTGLQLVISISGTLGPNPAYLGQVQLEQGTVATPFEWRSPQVERSACQRFYVASYPDGTAPGTASVSTYIGMPCSGSTTQLFGTVPFPVEMRANPAISLWSFAGTASKWSNGAGTDQAGTATLSANTKWVSNGGNSSALTLGTVYLIHYTASAEL